MAMRVALFLIGLVALAGCRGYSLDMSGLETYAVERTDRTNDRLSMSSLDRSVSPALENASDGLTMTDAGLGFERATAKTNERLNMTELDRASAKYLEPAGHGMTMSDLDRAVSGPLDPDNHKIKKK